MNPITSPLRILSQTPRYFSDATGRLVYLNEVNTLCWLRRLKGMRWCG